MMMPVPLRAADHTLDEQQFRALQGIISRETGIHLPEAKRFFLQARLCSKMRLLGLPSLDAFIDKITSGEGRRERDILISAVTTNVTSFFREEHHFTLLTDRILPPLLACLDQGGKVRIWSAACSTGEEAYSIAATLQGLCPDAARRDARILATDIDPEVLRTAAVGEYASARVSALPPHRRSALFSPSNPTVIREELRRLLRFRLLNLNGEWPMRGAFDVIFCRNAAIYFPRERQERLWQRFAALLPPGGWLILGHSERLTGPAARSFSCEGITAYRRLD